MLESSLAAAFSGAGAASVAAEAGAVGAGAATGAGAAAGAEAITCASVSLFTLILNYSVSILTSAKPDLAIKSIMFLISFGFIMS